MVLQAKAKFVSCKSSAEPESGVFLKNSALLTFVTSAPAGAAMVRHVYYPFMLQHTREECVGFLSDKGEILDSQFGPTIFRDAVRFVRRMCDIPDDYRFVGPDVRYNVEPTGASVDEHTIPLEDETPEHARRRAAARESARRQLRRGKEMYVSNNTYVSDKDIFAQCQKRAVYLPLQFGPHPEIPPPTHLDAIFVEEFDHQVAAMLAGDHVRAENATILAECFGAATEGLPAASSGLRRTLQDKAGKIIRQEEELRKMAEMTSGVLQNTYGFSAKKPPTTIRSRRFARQPGAQRLSRATRALLYKDCSGVDIKSSAIALAVQIVRRGKFEKISEESEIPAEFEDFPYCAQWVERRNSTASMLRESGALDPKKAVLKVCPGTNWRKWIRKMAENGGSAPELGPDGQKYLAGVSKEGRVFRTVAARLRPQALEFFSRSA